MLCVFLIFIFCYSALCLWMSSYDEVITFSRANDHFEIKSECNGNSNENAKTMSNRKRMTFELVDFWCHRECIAMAMEIWMKLDLRHDLVVHYVKISNLFPHEFFSSWKLQMVLLVLGNCSSIANYFHFYPSCRFKAHCNNNKK